MRALLLGLTMVASLLAPLASGAAAAAAPFLEDPEGDPQPQTLGGVGLPVAAMGGENVDLRTLAIAEDAESLTFVLTVRSLATSTPTFCNYVIDFSWKGTDYAIYIQRGTIPVLGDDDVDAYLISDGEDRFSRFADLPVEMDVAAGTFTVTLVKAYILDDRGRMPVLGEALGEVHVSSSTEFAFNDFTYTVADRMPDDGDKRYPFLFGDVSAGGLRLDADERVRVSNGGATTFVYQALLTNNATRDQTVDLVLDDMPEGWDGRVQSPIKVPAESERRITVLVSVPFAHDHGGFSSFNLTAKSQRDATAIASIRMGVVHTPIPQPAGHHSELYLHSEQFDRGFFGNLFPFGFAQGSMNTDAAHDKDAPSVSMMGGGWTVPLAPGLRMGLDFDTQKTGALVGSFVAKSTGAAKVSAELSLMSFDGSGDVDRVLLAESDTQDVTLDLTNPTPFALTLMPTPEADYVPYRKGQDLVLRIEVEREDGMPMNFCCIGTEAQLNVADFKLSLPLNEYHDRLTGLADVADVIGLSAEGAVEKLAMPGSVMTYTFRLTNDGPDADTIEIDVAGGDAALGQLAPAGEIPLGPRESQRVTLAVSVPANATDGQELEVLVFAHSQRDPSKTAIVRTLTTVVKAGALEAVPDESAVFAAAKEEAQKDTPLGGALLVLAAVALALLGRRR